MGNRADARAPQRARMVAQRNTLRRSPCAGVTGAFPTTSFEIRQLRWRDAASICTKGPKPGNFIGVLTSSIGRVHRRWTGPAARPDVSRNAPIGAMVFAIERRNHSRTAVYGDVCMGDPVDTSIAADRIQKSKKSFKFDRFDDCVRFGIRLGMRHAGRRPPDTRHTRHMQGMESTARTVRGGERTECAAFPSFRAGQAGVPMVDTGLSRLVPRRDSASNRPLRKSLKCASQKIFSSAHPERERARDELRASIRGSLASASRHSVAIWEIFDIPPAYESHGALPTSGVGSGTAFALSTGQGLGRLPVPAITCGVRT